MRVLCLCNVGTTDILLDGRPLPRPRDDGAALLLEGKGLRAARGHDGDSDWLSFRNSLSFPIIAPVLDYIVARHDSVSALVLFATDQDRSRAGDEHWQRDTASYGEFIRWWLLHGADPRPEVGKIEVKKLGGINPSMYDEAYECYGPMVARLDSPEVERAYVVLAGGTPACNTALILHTVRVFQERCEALYVPDGGGPAPLNIGRQLVDQTLGSIIEERLQTLDFTAALALMERQGHHSGLCALVAYASHRAEFDFEESQASLEEAFRRSADRPRVRAFLAELGDPLEPLRREELAALVAELHHNSRISFRLARYAGLLGRVFRLQEATARLVVERLHGVPTDDTKDRTTLGRFIESHPSLQAFLTSQTHEGQALRWDKVNVPLLMALIRYALEGGANSGGEAILGGEDLERYGTMYDLLGRMDSLRQLRNKSVIAHGFRGVSRRKIVEQYAGTDLFGDMEHLLDALGIPCQVDPFTPIVEFVVEELRRAP